ncbi:MAG TPA: hypothetical protein VLX91_10170 [Candidatus Acidoferrales bacterium]|nr:hypothetical protein [Candidatus Acidoferrales bacterium]
MDCLLLYSITTSPFPLQASAASGNPNVAVITVVATNNTGGEVPLQGIMVQIPVGKGSAQLTNDAKVIGAVPPDGWMLHKTSYPSGGVQYEFTPKEGHGTLANNASINFVFNNVQVNSQTGTVEIVVTEGSGSCTLPDCPVQKLFITKFPHGWGEVSFWAEPVTVPPGGNTTLHWNGPSGATYSIEFYTPQKGIVKIPAQGELPLSNQGQYPSQGDPPLTLQQRTVFTLNVTQRVEGQTYNAQLQKTVTVTEAPPPKINWFRVAPAWTDFSPGPQWVTLTWDASNAKELEIEGVAKVTGLKDYSTQVDKTTSFALRAMGSKQRFDLATVTVQSIRDYLATHSLRLTDHDFGSIPDSDGVWTFDYKLVETLTFRADGGGEYSYSIDGGSSAGRGRYNPRHERWGSATRWSLSGTIVTIDTGKGQIVLQQSASSFVYKKSLEISFDRHSFTFSPA